MNLLFQRIHRGTQCVHIFLRGGPASAEANAGVSGVHPRPVLIAKFLAQNGQLVIGDDGILLVSGGVKQQGIAVGYEDIPDLESLVDGVAGDLEVEIVGKQCVELDAQQTALCFIMKRKSFFSAGFMMTTASPNSAPTLVPPM